MNEIEKYFSIVYDKLADGSYTIETLEKCDPDIETKSNLYIKYLETTKNVDVDVLYRFIVIQLDYYTFSNIGNVLITDSDYDFATQCLKSYGIKIPTTTTFSPSSKTWQIKEHTAPQMVGSVEKVFSMEEVHNFIKRESQGVFGTTNVIFAPKYDGVGINIEYDPDLLDFSSALTRKDGMKGQELIKVIKNSKNYNDILMSAINEFGSSHGYIKGEILLSQSDFEELVKEKPYKNRRNGTSGVINTPSNIEYARYLTVKPLVYATENSRKKFGYNYCPDGSIIVDIEDLIKNPDMIDETINKILAETHNSEFEYRTDGVVIFIHNIHISYDNVMDHSIAFKTNSKVGITKIEYGYVSIGRTGKATPMIKVQPCDLNETMVTDVSLSNFTKVRKLGLHENDTIMLESSGDVIPMIKDIVKQGSPTPLYFDLRCPMCGKRLVEECSTKGEIEYACKNTACPRIVAGSVTNFLDKLGANGISDTTVLNVYQQLGLQSFSDFLDTEKYRDDLIQLPNWGPVSANNFIDEINRLKEKTVSYGEFIGSLGIPGISTKKCRNIFSNISYNDFVSAIKDRNYDKADSMLYGIDGMATKSITTFMDFFKENIDVIVDVGSRLNLVNDKVASANVVFTGIRDKDAELMLDKYGIETSDNINGKTIAVISANKSSGKSQKAAKMNIPIFDAYSSDMKTIVEYIVNNLL